MMIRISMQPAPQNLIEDELLQTLGRFVYLRCDQLTNRSYRPTSYRFVQKKLRSLVAQGFVEAHKTISRHPNPPLVYCPSVKGWKYLQSLGQPIPERWKAQEQKTRSYEQYRHDMAVADFGLLGEKLGKAASPQISCRAFLHDRFLPPFTVKTSGSKQTIRLDGLLSLVIKRSQTGKAVKRVLALELDRSSHYRKAVEQKLRGLLAFIDNCQDIPVVGVSSNELTNLWVCPDDAERVKQLLTYTRELLIAEQKLLYSDYFFFTSSNPATTPPLQFFSDGKLWYQPAEPDTPRCLLAVPAPKVRELLPPAHVLTPEVMQSFLKAIDAPITELNLEPALDD